MFKFEIMKMVVLLIVSLLASCSTVSTSPVPIGTCYHPTPVTETTINGIKIGLPKGWKSIKIDKNESPMPVISLQRKDLGFYLDIYKSPKQPDGTYGKNNAYNLLLSLIDSAPAKFSYKIGPVNNGLILPKSGNIIKAYTIDKKTAIRGMAVLYLLGL